MGVYNNNKDGTRSTLANTIQVVDAPMEQFISRGEFSAVTPNDVSAQNKLVTENEVTKAVSTMPTASADLVGTIVQYVGTTTANYTNGYFYKCVSDGAVTPTYSWIEVISGGGGDMLASVYDPNGTVAQAGGIEAYVGARYDTMPSNADLLAMPNNTIFFTKGFYSTNDKCGGYYLISTSATKGSLMVNYDDKTRYLTAIDVEGTTIDVCRYGVRSSTLLTDLTVENTYATSNSDIIENLYWPYLNCIFKFPSGRFYFARPLKTIGNGVELSIFGDRNSAVIDYDRINNNAFDKGTILAFPFLTNGQTAITLGSGTIKDVTILGDFTTYDITFDRTKTISAPNEVISETIKEVDGTQVKCTGLSHGAIIENVTVAGFYTGINEPNGNIVLTNINIFHCHTGIILHFDNKVTNLFGWSVYDFMELHNNCISVTTARVDSCVHMVVTKDYCGTLTLTDIDGDWCTDSMIYLTKDGQYGAVTDSIFDGIHGRCCTLKSYDSTQSDGVDVRDLADTNGYGYVRVDDGITCKNNQFTFNSIGNLASDVTNYLTPAIAITFGNIAPSENIFKTSDTIADILKVFQTSTNCQARVDLSSETYYINGNSVTKGSVDTTLAKNLVELNAVIDNVNHKVVKNSGDITYRFSVADVWSNDYTVKSYAENHTIHKRNGNSLKVVKNDTSKSSFFFTSLNQTLTGTTASTMGIWFYIPRTTYDLISYFNVLSGTQNQYGQFTNQETLVSIDKTSMNIGWNFFKFNNVTNDFDSLKISIVDTKDSSSETFDTFELYFDSIISNYEVVPTVLLAFDNCDDASMYEYCYAKASENGLVGTFAYQGGLTPDNPSNAVTRAHLTEMQESGWDVTQYDGSPMGGGITAIENYNRTLKSEGLDMFCYFPRYNDVTTDIWNNLDEMGFKMVRSANSNPFINAVGIGTYNCYGLTFANNATAVKDKIDTAISDKKILAIIIHIPVDADDGTTSNCLKTDYEEVMSYLGEKQKTNDVQVITYKELYYSTVLTDGVTPTITATATVDNTSGTPSVNVTKSGTDANPSFEFAFSGLKGADGSGSGTGLNDSVKAALLQIAEKVAYVDANGQSYYNALYNALYNRSLVSISAVYTQSGTVYPNTSLDDLKTDLVVTALYDDSTTEVLTAYTLSGTLTEGTSTITVTSGGCTTTFDVIVSASTEKYSYSYANGELVKYNAGLITVTGEGRLLNLGDKGNRRTFLVTEGVCKARQTNDGGTTITDSDYYPVKIPSDATSVTATITPSTLHLALCTATYADGKYNVIEDTGWGAKGTLSMQLTPRDDAYLFINTRSSEYSGGYNPEPTDFTITFTTD